MRILFWCDPFWPAVGGIPVIATKFAAALAERGHQLDVVTDEAPAQTVPPPGLRAAVHRYPFLRVLRSADPAQTVSLARSIAELKRAVRPDLILLYALSPAVFFHLRTRQAWPAPSIVTMHSGVPRGAAATDGVVGQTLTDANWVMACCRSALEEACDRYPFIAGRSSVVRNAVEPQAEPVGEPSLDPPRLLHVGRLAPEKGADLAIAALPAVLERAPAARLRIAGDGPERQALEERAAELGVADRIEFLGFVSQGALPRLLADSSMLVQPSRSEGISLAALEAAHAGRPVVASCVGGFPELVVDGETGLLVPPESAGALADAILRLIGDPAGARRMAANGRRRAQRAFRWSYYVDAYDERIRGLGDAR